MEEFEKLNPSKHQSATEADYKYRQTLIYEQILKHCTFFSL